VPPACAGYAVSVVNHYLGRHIRHGGVRVGPTVKLFDRERVRFETRSGMDVERPAVVVDGRWAAAGGDLLRYRYEAIEEHIDAIQSASTRRARRLVDGGRRSSDRWLPLPVRAFVAPPMGFVRDYILRGGFLDGRRGFLFCLISSYGVFLDHAKTWEALKRRTHL